MEASVLFVLDELPARCSIGAQVEAQPTCVRIRFQAERRRPWRRRVERSEWSGWFVWRNGDEPIVLVWSAFWA